MNDSMNKFLLSTLLAIRESGKSLDSEEKESLYIIGEQLSIKPTAWETDIESNLMGIINSNLCLNTIFQDFKSQLEKIDNISEDFIPTQDELATVISSTNAVGQRPIIRPDPSDLNSDREIINMTIQVFSSPEPSEVVKKISKFERLLNFIRQSLSKNK